MQSATGALNDSQKELCFPYVKQARAYRELYEMIAGFGDLAKPRLDAKYKKMMKCHAELPEEVKEALGEPEPLEPKDDFSGGIISHLAYVAKTKRKLAKAEKLFNELSDYKFVKTKPEKPKLECHPQ